MYGASPFALKGHTVFYSMKCCAASSIALVATAPAVVSHPTPGDAGIVLILEVMA